MSTHSTFHECYWLLYTLFLTHKKPKRPPKLRENSTLVVTTHPPTKTKAVLEGIKVMCKVTFSFHPLFLFAFTPYPLFDWYSQRKEILLNLSTKCWNSAFNAQQGSRVIIVVLRRVKALKEMERGDETQFTTKISWKTSWGPSYFDLSNFIPS
jgi:hypothetical protein